MRRIVSFDLDGTLLDSVVDIASALNTALDTAGLAAFDVDTVRSFVGNGARQLVLRAVSARGVPERAPAVLAQFQHAYERSLLQHTTLYPGIRAMLHALHTRRQKDVVFAVCTNKPGVYARPLVQALLPDVMHGVFGPDDVGALKPDPATLVAVQRALRGRVVAHIGDSPVDVQTAKAHGVASVAVSWGLSPSTALVDADEVVHNAAELQRVVTRLLA